MTNHYHETSATTRKRIGETRAKWDHCTRNQFRRGTPDLKSAHVFVSTLGADNGSSVIDKLEAHRPALQAELSRHVVLKYTPHLIFHLDESIKRGARVLEILDDLGTGDREDK